MDDADFLWGKPGYSEVFDEDGGGVTCDRCGEDMLFDENNSDYACSCCGRRMSRAEFFYYIGAQLPGDECISCNELYPGCQWCPHGLVEEDDDF